MQACDKGTHAHLMIFILTKTQRKFIEVNSLSKCPYIFIHWKKGPTSDSEINKVNWEFAKALCVLEELSAWLARKHTRLGEKWNFMTTL